MPDGLTMTVTAAAARFRSDTGRFVQRVRTDGTRTTHDQMMTTRQRIIANSPVDTGALQQHWGPVADASTGDVLASTVTNSKDYAVTLEYGGYRRVGPRTVRLSGGDLGAGFTAGAGVYSQQAPLGWVRKELAYAWPQYRLRITNMVKQAWPYRSS